MSRKDYIAVAKILNAELSVQRNSESACHSVTNIARSLADVFKRDNSAFDRQRFYDAVTDGTGHDRLIA